MQTFYLFIKSVIKISVFHIYKLKNHSAGPLGVKFSVTTQSTFCQYFSLLRIRILKNLRENLEKLKKKQNFSAQKKNCFSPHRSDL